MMEMAKGWGHTIVKEIVWFAKNEEGLSGIREEED